MQVQPTYLGRVRKILAHSVTGSDALGARTASSAREVPGAAETSHMWMASNFNSVCFAEIQIGLGHGRNRVDEGPIHIKEDTVKLQSVGSHVAMSLLGRYADGLKASDGISHAWRPKRFMKVMGHVINKELCCYLERAGRHSDAYSGNCTQLTLVASGSAEQVRLHELTSASSTLRSSRVHHETPGRWSR